MILKVYYDKRKNIYYPVNNWTSEIKNNKLTYWSQGNRYKKISILKKEYKEYNIKRVVNFIQLHRMLKKYDYDVMYNFLDEVKHECNLNFYDAIKKTLFLSSTNLEYLKIVQDFENIFQVRFLTFMDYMMRLCGVISFDIIKFDEYISKKHENYSIYNGKISLNDFIKKEYGIKASETITKLLK